MGIVATWKTTCDHCSRTVKKTITLNKKTLDLGFDAWEPGIPNGWIQVGRDNNVPVILHRKCTEPWIRKHQGDKAAEDFRNAVWMA